MNVDLPAPFGPVNPYRRPAENVTVTSSNKTFEPNRMETPCAEIITAIRSFGKTRLCALRFSVAGEFDWTNLLFYREMESPMTFRKDLLTLLSAQPRSVSSIARELGLTRTDVEDDLRHLIRSARAAGHHVMIEPARCRSCGFTFGDDKLAKPGKCPECRGTWLYDAQISITE